MVAKNPINQAVSILKQGGLVALPTETVYGLAADARNSEAVRKIFTAKGRPADHPLIVHIADIAQLKEWAVDISEDALLLANTFWPGPLTLILKKAPAVLDLITGGQDTVGLRIPAHPLAREVLKEFGSGLAAPSANRFGRISPTTAQAVKEELGNEVDFILEGGPCEVGVESTIVDMSSDEVVILRPGMITSNEIEAVLKRSVSVFRKNAPRVSGSLESHYAPETVTQLLPRDELLVFLKNIKSEHLPIAVMSLQMLPRMEGVSLVEMPGSCNAYAHDLYNILRELDKKKFQKILIETVPSGEDWDAIRDRLTRATFRVIV
jgi:L-threonylcarbamoyladenylate synthase